MSCQQTHVHAACAGGWIQHLGLAGSSPYFYIYLFIYIYYIYICMYVSIVYIYIYIRVRTPLFHVLSYIKIKHVKKSVQSIADHWYHWGPVYRPIKTCNHSASSMTKIDYLSLFIHHYIYIYIIIYHYIISHYILLHSPLLLVKWPFFWLIPQTKSDESPLRSIPHSSSTSLQGLCRPEAFWRAWPTGSWFQPCFVDASCGSGGVRAIFGMSFIV